MDEALRRDLDAPGIPGDVRAAAEELAAVGDEVGARRLLFEAKVRHRAPAAGPAPGGKGSPPALLAIGAVGSGSLGACAALLGGGLLYVPAAIPLVTVIAVLLARRAARSGGGR